MEKTNYHTHTTRCLHAEGSDEAYVQTAMDGSWDAGTDKFIGEYTSALLKWVDEHRKD